MRLSALSLSFLVSLLPWTAFADDVPCTGGVIRRVGGSDCHGESPFLVDCNDPESVCSTIFRWSCSSETDAWESYCVPAGYESYNPPGGHCAPECAESCAPDETRPCTPSGETTPCGVETCEDGSWSTCAGTPECSDEGSGNGGGGGGGGGGGSGSGGGGPPPPPPGGNLCGAVGDPIDVTTGFMEWRSIHDDAPLDTDRGGMHLGRVYASRRVGFDLMRVDSGMPASARALAIASTPQNGLGVGWTHAYDHWLVIDTDILHVRPNADSEYYTQDPVTSTLYHPDRVDGTLLTQSGGQWILENPDQSRLIFEGTTLAHLVAVINARQQRLDLKYYGASEPDSCSTSNTAIQGKLCTVKDPFGSTVRLIYNSQGLLTETRASAPGASTYNATTYAYTGYGVHDLNGIPMLYDVSLLTEVDFSSVDKELYSQGNRI